LSVSFDRRVDYLYVLLFFQASLLSFCVEAVCCGLCVGCVWKLPFFLFVCQFDLPAQDELGY
jgi:hypothetical protein